MPKISPIIDTDFMPKWAPTGPCAGQPHLMEPAWTDDDAIEQARAVCYSCPVLDRCRRWVLSLPPSGDPGGVIAAMTPAERGLALEPEDRKQCTTCNEWLPLDDFSLRSPQDGQRRSHCRGCMAAARRASYTPAQKTEAAA